MENESMRHAKHKGVFVAYRLLFASFGNGAAKGSRGGKFPEKSNLQCSFLCIPSSHGLTLLDAFPSISKEG